MSISDLVPWRWGKKRVPVQRQADREDEARSLSTRDDVLSPWFDDMWNRFGLAPFNSFFEETLTPRVDVYETDRDIVVTAALPGVEPADVEVTLERGVLTLRGEIKPPLGNVNYWVQEIPYGRFARSLTLNIPLQEDEISASFDKGILTVYLPKAAAARPRTIAVNVKQG